ncbi:MAG TPA: M15 family metallopeptidase [Thermomicrobiales bacterium]|nr:M15 family metallopeptidase [Thermomicrobiales bacterium]
MTFTTRQSSWPQKVAGALTLLIALVLVLISFTTATGWSTTRITNSSVSDGIAEETVTGLVVAPTSPPSATTAATLATSTQAPAVVDAEHIADEPVTAEGEHSLDGPVGREDGYIPDGEVLSPWDTHHPAVGNLDPGLLDAVQQAATDAEAEGIVMVVSSGWRSPRYQQALLDEAIVTYGSEEEARKWVNTPDKSSHVTGDGIDIGYTDADYWLIEHGYMYGLCQTYANEIWHFELAVEPGETCPPPLSDAAANVPADTSAGTTQHPPTSNVRDTNQGTALLEPLFSSTAALMIFLRPLTTLRGRADQGRRSGRPLAQAR